MIELRNLTKIYRLNGVAKPVARDITFTFPSGECVGLMGPNGAGKSTMLKLIAGTVQPDSGEIIRHGSISWPVGFAGSFHGDLTGAQNVRFVARLYGVDTEELTEFARDFSQLGAHFYLPIRTYSSGMRARLAFGLSMAIDFDTYLVDEVTAVGDNNFRTKCRAAFAERRERSSIIIVSHNLGTIREYADRYALLRRGQLTFYDDLAEIERLYKAAA